MKGTFNFFPWFSINKEVFFSLTFNLIPGIEFMYENHGPKKFFSIIISWLFFGITFSWRWQDETF